MSIAARSRRLGRSYARNIARLALGAPLTYPSLGSMTLEKDDVALARRILAQPSQWDSRRYIDEFESLFAEWNASKYAFSFMSARVALSACIHALGLREGDEVVVPGYTCIAVPNAFRFAGARVVFADIELETYGLDAAQLEQCITPRTRAVVIQHLYGLVSRDYEAIVSFCRARGLSIIEDCAQATGAEFKGRKVGALGDAAIYSSEQSKVFSTVQGGVAATDSKVVAGGLRDFYERARLPTFDWVDRQLHNVILNFYEAKHAHRAWTGPLVNLRYGHKTLISTTDEELAGGRPDHYGCRMAAPIAALGCNQLAKVDRFNALRRAGARQWDEWCHRSSHVAPRVIEGSVPVYLRYPVLVDPERKADTSWSVGELGVRVGVWMVTNLHPAPGNVPGCPNADLAVRCCVNLPTLDANDDLPDELDGCGRPGLTTTPC